MSPAENNAARRILVVDDDPAILRIYSETLARDGFQVDTAAEGQAAFRLATTRDYDLVLMDINMPNWNGVDAIRSLKMLKPALRIGVISANLKSREYVEAKPEMELVGELSKPVSLQALLDFARKHAGK